MRNKDRDYYLGRAEAELQLAQSGSHEAATRAHYELAGLYFDRVFRRDDKSISKEENGRNGT